MSAGIAPAAAAQAMLDLAHELIGEARARHAVLRLSGSLAIRYHCREQPELLDSLDREPPGDVDLFGYWKQCSVVEQMLVERNYEPHPALAHSKEFGVKRLIYFAPRPATKVEVFFDTLKMSHEIDLRGRLERDFPTVGIEELLLSKLQIHELTAKDVKDITALVAIHDFGPDDDPEKLHLEHIAKVICEDWGLWYTAMANLDATLAALDTVTMLSPATRTAVAERVGRLREALAQTPKSMRWKMRARIGPRARWYEDVGDVDR
jgi:hypothetical protein